jgi:hypothetical protein
MTGAIFGPPEQPPGVRWLGYELCRGCSRGLHIDHGDPCMCDICEEASDVA